jgi:glycosyltransferase involved in cell wall biosynthesis
MKIGLVLQSGVELGGAHNYEANFRISLIKVATQLSHDVKTFVPQASKKTDNSQDFVFYRSSPVRYAFAHLRSNPLFLALSRLIGLGRSHLEKQAIREGVDILLFASPNHLSPGIQTVPIATTAWDFGHLDLPHFPETGQNGLWQWREELYTATVARSVAIYCDSTSTKLRLVQRYGAQNDRVNVVGLFPSIPDGVIPEKLNKPHFIYPAMFWPHKNHLLLLSAFADFIAEKGSVAYLVLTGAGQLQKKVQAHAESLGLSELVKFKGLVSRMKLMGLLAGSKGLLMPSLLGPSNIPPLEAALLGVPVVASDVHMMDEMLGGLHIVPSADIKSWTTAFNKLWDLEIKTPVILEQDEEEQIRKSLAFIASQLQGLRK